MSALVHGGAAGGIAAGLHTLLNAKLEPGIEYFLDNTGFDQILKTADLLITGEGSLDMQSLRGKAPVGAAARAKKIGIPVIAMAGNISANAEKALKTYFDILLPVNPGLISLEEALAGTAHNLQRMAQITGDLLALGAKNLLP
jgi:glycerate kinase